MTTNEWPKRTKIYVCSDKDQNWEVGERLGLTEDAIRKNFKYTLMEIAVEIEVNKDGTYKIIGASE